VTLHALASRVIQLRRRRLALDDRPVTGLMARFLGDQYSIEQLSETDDFEHSSKEERDAIASIRAFPVKSLIGAQLHASNESDLATQLGALLRHCCPGVEWQLDHDLGGPLRKCGFLHTSLAAPPDDTTGQTMALEVFGDTIQLGTHDFTDPNAPSWILLRYESGVSDWDTPIDEPLTLRIKAATYANVSHPGVGVGFYM
jgi:hypothetical protein